jgi:hypothetical protein
MRACVRACVWTQQLSRSSSRLDPAPANMHIATRVLTVTPRSHGCFDTARLRANATTAHSLVISTRLSVWDSRPFQARQRRTSVSKVRSLHAPICRVVLDLSPCTLCLALHWHVVTELTVELRPTPHAYVHAHATYAVDHHAGLQHAVPTAIPAQRGSGALLAPPVIHTATHRGAGSAPWRAALRQPMDGSPELGLHRHDRVPTPTPCVSSGQRRGSARSTLM